MERDSEIYLTLTSQVLKLATDHPYAATGVIGAAIGSAITYKVMTIKSLRQKVAKAFTPKVYQINVPAEDLRKMLIDSEYEIRWEMPDASVIVTAEPREQLKELPDIQGEVID